MEGVPDLVSLLMRFSRTVRPKSIQPTFSLTYSREIDGVADGFALNRILPLDIDEIPKEVQLLPGLVYKLIRSDSSVKPLPRSSCFCTSCDDGNCLNKFRIS